MGETIVLVVVIFVIIILIICCWDSGSKEPFLLTDLESQTAKFIKDVSSSTPIYKLDPKQARQVLEKLQSEQVSKLDVLISDLVITEKNIPIRIIRPTESEDRILPAVIYIHGGGWILGSKDTHDRLIRELATKSNVAVIFVSYTPSPEARFPIAIEQAYLTTKYIAENGHKLNLDPSRLAVVGDSVGGNMAIAVTLLAKILKGPKITCQALFYPVTDSNFNTDSYNKYENGPWLTKAAMQWFWDAYEPNKKNRCNFFMSPLRAPTNILKNLPPALVITDENDVLRDEGEKYAHKLIEAGVDTIAIRCIGTVHDFMMLNQLAETPATRISIDIASSYLIKYLHAH
jgi:acetyl esterase